MISLVITIKNERQVLEPWLASIEEQSLLPDEIVVVDGNSNDGTWEWLQEKAKAHKLLKIFQEPGNIAHGRNFAISQARGECIAVTDAGCTYDHDWLRKLTEPLVSGKAQFAATAFGPWLQSSASVYGCAFAAVTTPRLNEFKHNWLPSSRSVAFTKDLWHTVGGYPEWIPYCEDVIFDLKLKEKAQIYYVREPLVLWAPRPSLRAFCKQLYNYTRSEGHGRLNTARQFIRFAAYAVGVALAVLSGYSNWFLLPLGLGFAGYVRKFWLRSWEFTKNFSISKKTEVAILVPFLLVVGDIAKMCGWPVGVFQRMTGKIVEPKK